MNNQGRQVQGGFTLIELVMVIVLISIMSYGAASLFASRDAYSGYIAQDQLISSALLAQQVALGMSATNNPVSLSVGVEAIGGKDHWFFDLTKVGEPTIRVTQEPSGSSLVIDGTTIGSGSSQTFTWDSRANLTSGNNHEIRFSGDMTYRVCLSSSGYAYESTVACPCTVACP